MRRIKNQDEQFVEGFYALLTFQNKTGKKEEDEGESEVR